ncbi:cytochrome c, somatic-like [Amphiura filiformis]|uniref:cytochrome c, somatic-like n=1 Tax=Amphiura filiformis TaxID=82378 RepID=UPI003B220A39
MTFDDDAPVGDPKRGAIIFKEHCAFCHSLEEKGGHKRGPNLWGLWGRQAGSAPGFKYVQSDEKKGIWGDKTLWQFFTGPHIPGTKMVFKDLKEDKQERADLLTYLKENTGSKKE